MVDKQADPRRDTVAWVGFGAMGRPMADRLTAAGHRVIPLDPRTDRDPAAVLAEADVAVTCLPGPDEVRAVWTGPGGLVEAMRPGSVLVDVSTIGPATAVDLAEAAAARGMVALDCPVSGGPQGAVAGTLAVMAGGDPDAVDRVRPMLETFGTVHECGKPGSGQAVKLINQSVLAGMLGGLGLGFALATRSGIDPELMHGVLSGGVVRGFLTDALWPLMAADDLAAGFAAKHMVKDIGLCREYARDAAVSEALLDTVDSWLRTAMEVRGGGVATQAIGQGVLA
ncbi:NAD(P)-dependent oxidoreductase [Rhodococcus olei]|uniref:NAD(P)-dependent oxidoreductase n=1 Tax=Rhodococcus olei TaxID=2161675 RepID=A0ABP8P9B7_9NOCA